MPEYDGRREKNMGMSGTGHHWQGVKGNIRDEEPVDEILNLQVTNGRAFDVAFIRDV
jgi:hypothetical protein